jgi:hypothetical protein
MVSLAGESHGVTLAHYPRIMPVRVRGSAFSRLLKNDLMAQPKDGCDDEASA